MGKRLLGGGGGGVRRGGGLCSTRMVLQVHDELVFEVPKAEVPEVAPAVPSSLWISGLPSPNSFAC